MELNPFLVYMSLTFFNKYINIYELLWCINYYIVNICKYYILINVKDENR